MGKLKVSQELIDVILEQTFINIYPIGSIYISINDVNPRDLFGGKWERIKGKYLLGVDPDTTMEHKTPSLHIGSWDTEDTVLNVNQIPAHSHGIVSIWGNGGSVFGEKPFYTTVGSGQGTLSTKNTGGGKGHHHRCCPPSFTVYMWYRTA